MEIDEQEYQKLIAENTRLKQSLDKREGIFKITCKHCGKVLHFFIDVEDVKDKERFSEELLNCNYYFAKKCESNKNNKRKICGGDEMADNTHKLKIYTEFAQEIKNFYGQDILDRTIEILKIIEGCTVLEARTILLIVEEVILRSNKINILSSQKLRIKK